MRTCLIVGCGYVGTTFADFADRHGWKIRAIVRSPASRDQLQQRDWDALAWDWQTEPPKFLFEGVDLVLFAVSHANSNSQPHLFHPVGMSHVRDSLAVPPPAIYLSTTGVFSPSQGEWVDEDSPVAPSRSGSIAALAGESFLNEHWPNRSAILRLAGIYGPNRIPNLAALRDSQPLSIDPNTFLNLIHVADVVGVAMHIAERWHGAGGSESAKPYHHRELYCVSDGNPVLRGDYYQTIAQHLSLPNPRFQSAMDQRSGRGFDHKRVSNRRLRELGYTLQYPSFLEGLLPLLRSEGMS